jgi:hypothetical protein
MFNVGAAGQGHHLRRLAPVLHSLLPSGCHGVCLVPADELPSKVRMCRALVSAIMAMLDAACTVQPHGSSADESCSCRIAFIYAVSVTYRLRYYFAWAVSESSLIFSGLSFNGYDDSTGHAK